MSWTALAAGLLSGIIGAMGLGGGAVLIIYLSVFTDMPQLKRVVSSIFRKLVCSPK